MITYRTGDLIVDIRNALLLDSGTHYFAHGANCYAAMGGGVAAALAAAYPKVAEIDRKWGVPLGKERLGRSTFAGLSSGVGVFNLYSQLYPGPHFSGEALASALEEVKARGVDKLTIPKIGAGIGGAAWEDVVEVLEASGLRFDVVVLPG
jgi:O-acetyl-ADP-ribose deacetylase (regulator of RNase III)